VYLNCATNFYLKKSIDSVIGITLDVLFPLVVRGSTVFYNRIILIVEYTLYAYETYVERLKDIL
jgi:hypothetical protein